jgi:glycosyltransferase involved in cell wall biosynthesis
VSEGSEQAKMKSPTLTAVMVNYNHSRFIPESLGSLLAQKRPADELIVIDDASNDGSAALIEEMLKGHAYARLLRNDCNLGCVGTMNRGLGLARGDYVFLAASDDVFYPELFEQGMGLLARHPQAALFSSRCDVIDENGGNKHFFVTPVPDTEEGYVSPSRAAIELYRNDSWFMGNTSIYRREYLLAEGGFNPELRSLADGFISRVLALKHGACFSPDALGSWRRQRGGMAWSQAMNADHAPMFALVEEEIRKRAGLFPIGYSDRWRRRYLFGAAHFVRMQRASEQSGPGRSLARLTAIIVSVCQFLLTRPFDVWPAAVRFLSSASK